MNANFLKKIYLRIGSNRVRFYLISLMKFFKIRHLVVRIDTNHLCNLRCRMCYFSNRETKHIGPQSLELYNKIAKELFLKTKILYLSCTAEPLCTPNIDEYIKIAKKYKVPFISIVSNCMLLTEDKIYSLVKSGLNEITVSITGGTKETYEENHVGATWEKLWANLKRLDEIKKELSSSIPEIKFNYILTKKSINEINGFIEKIAPFNPKYVTLRELVRFERMDENFYLNNKLDKITISMVDKIKKKFENAGISVVNSLQCTESIKQPYRKIPEKYPCVHPFFNVYIDALGNVKYCLFRESIGNLQSHSLKEIEKSEKALSMLKALKNKKECTCLQTCPNFNPELAK